MPDKKIIHVIGTGTIGEPLIGLLSDYKDKLGVDQVTFHKNSALKGDYTKVIDLQKRGAHLAVDNDKIKDFLSFGMEPEYETEEAISRASVVIDCTPKGIGHKNKEQYYSKFSSSVKGFLAQGSESEFGKKYALGINDDALNIAKDQFIQIVSCNTHNISCITNTIALNENNAENLLEGKYVCVRRANDMHQEEGYIPSPLVNKHITEQFGSHHAEDAANLFKTLNYDLNLFSSAMKVNSQYMHVLWFSLKVDETISLDDVKHRLYQNQLVAFTTKNLTSRVFSFGRDHGHYGRILNQTVVVEQTLNVKNGNEISGFCFTPQDGNSILSSLSASLWFLYPNLYKEKIKVLSHLFFDNI